LITEAEVRIGDNTGYAMMMGMELEATLAGAILDAAVESGHPLSSEIIDLLRTEEKRLKNELEKMRSKVNTTKVDFEAMM
jgi:phosphonate C-P lyase system protein PhnG